MFIMPAGEPRKQPQRPQRPAVSSARICASCRATPAAPRDGPRQSDTRHRPTPVVSARARGQQAAPAPRSRTTPARSAKAVTRAFPRPCASGGLRVERAGSSATAQSAAEVRCKTVDRRVNGRFFMGKGFRIAVRWSGAAAVCRPAWLCEVLQAPAHPASPCFCEHGEAREPPAPHSALRKFAPHLTRGSPLRRWRRPSRCCAGRFPRTLAEPRPAPAGLWAATWATYATGTADRVVLKSQRLPAGAPGRHDLPAP